MRVQRIGHDCFIGAETFDDLHRPRVVDRQRASALLVALLSDGFRNRDLRDIVAPLIGLSVETYGQGRATYELRRLRQRGLIERVPFTNRYRVTDVGLRTAMCCHRTYARMLRPAMSVVFDFDAPTATATRLNRAVGSFDQEIQRLWAGH